MFIIATLVPASQLHTSALNKKKINQHLWEDPELFLSDPSGTTTRHLFQCFVCMYVCVILVCYLFTNHNKLNHHLQALKHCRELFRRNYIDFQWPLYKKGDVFLRYNLQFTGQYIICRVSVWYFLKGSEKLLLKLAAAFFIAENPKLFCTPKYRQNPNFIFFLNYKYYEIISSISVLAFWLDSLPLLRLFLIFPSDGSCEVINPSCFTLMFPLPLLLPSPPTHSLITYPLKNYWKTIFCIYFCLIFSRTDFSVLFLD